MQRSGKLATYVNCKVLSQPWHDFCVQGVPAARAVTDVSQVVVLKNANLGGARLIITNVQGSVSC